MQRYSFIPITSSYTIDIMEKDLKRTSPLKELTLEEMRDAARKRVSLISKEFKEGFEFLSKHPKSVTFYGSARLPETDLYYKKAQSLSFRLAKYHGYDVITGGGPGIMEAAHRGAYNADGNAIGMTIKLPHEQITNQYVTEELSFYYFFSRKVMLSFAAEAYVFFPGGFGTLDEFFEIVTLVQTGKIAAVPIILFGSEFWKPLETFMQQELITHHTISENDLNLFLITDDEDLIINTIIKAPVRNGLSYNHYAPHAQTETIPQNHNALHQKHCVPCEQGAEPLTKELCEQYMDNIVGWDLIDNKRLTKFFVFKDFTEAMDFVADLADMADEEGHHPDFSVHDWNRVDVSLTTHAAQGLTENDFIMAAKINEAEEALLKGGPHPVATKKPRIQNKK